MSADDREVVALSELIARMSAATLGLLKPTDPYPGKPCAPIEEILRLRLAAEILAREAALNMKTGPDPEGAKNCLAAAMDEAAEQIPIPYRMPQLPVQETTWPPWTKKS